MSLNSELTLFAPGPIMTSKFVQKAMIENLDSQDPRFVKCVKEIREHLITMAEVNPEEWNCVFLQGSGTMGIEAALSTVLPRNNAKCLVVNTGSYADRQVKIAEKLGATLLSFEVPPTGEVDLEYLEEVLKGNSDITTVGITHLETATGRLAPINEFSKLFKKYIPEATVILDACNTFGGVKIPVNDVCDVLVTTPNYCLHSIPGCSIIFSRCDLLVKNKGNSRSFTLDLSEQYTSLEKTGRSRFTTQVHVMTALRQAIAEHERKGSIAGRTASYKAKSEVAIHGLRSLGFKLLLDEHHPSFGYIVLAFHMPTHKKWNFQQFCKLLEKQALIINPGKSQTKQLFRFGIIGETSVQDMVNLIDAARKALTEMGITYLKDSTQFDSKL